MKRILLLSLLLAVVAVAVQGSYKIQLKDGKIITSDDKVVVKGDVAFFTKRSVTYYLPVSRLDQDATARINVAPVADGAFEPIEVAPAVTNKPIMVDEEQLEKISGRSRLANDGQFKNTAAAETVPPVAREGSEERPRSSAGSDRNELNQRLADLIQQQSGLQKDIGGLQNKIAALKDSYNSNPQHDEREAVQAQIDAANGDLQAVQNSLSSVQGQIQSTQQQMNSAPVVVEMGGDGKPPQTPPTPPQPRPGT